MVRMFRFGFGIVRMPESRLLQIKYVCRQIIGFVHFFAVGIGYFPMLAGYRFTVFAQNFQLCDSCIIITAVCIQGFDREIPYFLFFTEIDMLPAVAGLKASGIGWSLTRQIKFLIELAMRIGTIAGQLI